MASSTDFQDFIKSTPCAKVVSAYGSWSLVQCKPVNKVHCLPPGVAEPSSFITDAVTASLACRPANSITKPEEFDNVAKELLASLDHINSVTYTWIIKGLPKKFVMDILKVEFMAVLEFIFLLWGGEKAGKIYSHKNDLFAGSSERCSEMWLQYVDFLIGLVATKRDSTPYYFRLDEAVDVLIGSALDAHIAAIAFEKASKN